MPDKITSNPMTISKFVKLLQEIEQEYGSLPIYINEEGYGESLLSQLDIAKARTKDDEIIPFRIVLTGS